MSDENKVQASDNSNAVGSISAGGDISGNIHIGNVYQTPEDDLPLSSDEIENGLTRFAQFLPERAPVLQDSFSSIAKKLRATLGADQNSLSPALKVQREDGVNRMKLMCMEVTDISFRAICLGQNPPPYDSRPPFLGLFAFRPEDREFFFGRDALVQKLVARIKAHPFLAVLGASGSGKSSLVMAGLVPGLEAEMSYLTPSSAPLSQLLTAKESASAKTVFVIDQFEELFTHPHDAAERADFIHALLNLTKTNRVVITMRADFWGEVAIYADLKQAMQEHQELIAPMTVDELHSAMEKQAAVVGLRFDPTLSDSILAEVKGEPGAMPLLQHALWELWNRRHGLWIKAEEYKAFGGVKQAIASTAEEAYASCSDFERARVRDIFLRLTRLDESGEGRDTRRCVLIEELIPVNSDSSVTINLLDKLADARLIVKTEADVEVAHEALIRHWSRLTEWLNEDRDNLRLREGVSESAREWEDSKRDDSLLNHRGGRLDLALAMSKLPQYQLNMVELSYLDACLEAKERDIRARDTLRKRIWTGLLTALVVALSLAGFAFYQMSLAKHQSTLASSRELAAVATSKYSSDPELSLLLAIEAVKAARTEQSENALRQILFSYPLQSVFQLNTDLNPINVTTFSEDGKWLYTINLNRICRVWDIETNILIDEFADCSHIDSNNNLYVTNSEQGVAQVWNIVTNKQTAELQGDTVDALDQVISPDSDIVITFNTEAMQIWDITTGKILAKFSRQTKALGTLSTPNKKLIATRDEDGTIRIVDLFSGKSLSKLQMSVTGTILARFSPDGLNLVTVNEDGTVKIWETASGNLITELQMYYKTWPSIAFSPDSKLVILTNEDDFATQVWDIKTGQLVSELRGHTSGVTQAAFSPDGNIVMTASFDGTARLWEPMTGKSLAVIFSNSVNVKTAVFSPDGKFIGIAGYPGLVKVWNTSKVVNQGSQQSLELRGHSDSVKSASFSPDSHFVVTAGDVRALVWDANTGQIITTISLPKRGINVQTRFIESAVFSRDGKFIITTATDGYGQIWDVATGKNIDDSLDITTETEFLSTSNSPDGRFVARITGNKIGVFEISNGEQVAELPGHFATINSAVFSPDGKLILTASADKTARIFHWESFLTIENLVALAKTHVFRSLSCEEQKTYLHITTCMDPSTNLYPSPIP